MNAQYDVLIVGAGCAGLAAGLDLVRAGRRVAILEARDRVGGRIFTRYVARPHGGEPVPVELGAEFIHGLPQITWQLVEEAKLNAYELDGSELFFANGQWQWPVQGERSSRWVLEDMMRWLARQPEGCDMNFAEYLASNRVDAASGEVAGNYVEGFNAADRNRIGIAALAKQQSAEDAIDADRLFRVTAGYDALPRYLSSEFVRVGGTLALDAAVTSIAWQRGRVSVRLRDVAGGDLEWSAKQALITVPLGVLQARTIEMTPRPADILAQADRLAMGDVLRVILIFGSRFWCDRPGASIPPGMQRELDNLSFLFASSELPPTWWTPMPDRTPALTAWMGGPKAAAWARQSGSFPEASRGQCLSTLAKVFGLTYGELEKSLVSSHSHDWSADEYARGAYSYVPAGSMDAPLRMTMPVEDTLYFAGEHTDTTGHWGTVHAALGSGRRAAAQILSAPRL